MIYSSPLSAPKQNVVHAKKKPTKSHLTKTNIGIALGTSAIILWYLFGKDSLLKRSYEARSSQQIDEELEKSLKIEAVCKPEDFGKARFRYHRTFPGWGTDDSTQGFVKALALLNTLLAGKPSKDVDSFEVLKELAVWQQDSAPDYYKTKGINGHLYAQFGLGAAINRALEFYKHNKGASAVELATVTNTAPPTNGTLMNSSVAVIANHSNLEDAQKCAKALAHATHNNPQIDCFTELLTEMVWQGVNQATSTKSPQEKIRSIVFDTLKKYKKDLHTKDYFQKASAKDRKAMEWIIDKNLSFEHLSKQELGALHDKMEDASVLRQFYDHVVEADITSKFFGTQTHSTIRQLGALNEVVYYIDSTGYGGGSLTSAIWSLLMGSYAPTTKQIAQSSMNYCQNLRGDADTTMAILGQLLGSMCKSSGLPQYWHNTLVQKDFAAGVTQALYLGGTGKKGQALSQDMNYSHNKFDEAATRTIGTTLLANNATNQKLDACLGIMLGMMAGDSMGAGPEVLPGNNPETQLRGPALS